MERKSIDIMKDTKDKVRKLYPEAFCAPIDYGYGIFENKEKLDKWKSIGHSKFNGATIEKAWEDAVQKLQKQ